MRTIKFRAWDVKRKHFIYHNTKDADTFCISLDGRFGYEWTSEGGGGIQWRDEDRFILQQFTDLVDKQGKEIYEGDIVDVGISNMLNDERYLCYVDYIPANFIFRNLNESLSTTSPLLSFNNSTMFKVIGNIFESPELLKGGR